MRILKQKAIHKVGMLVLALGLTITAWASDFSTTKMQAEQGIQLLKSDWLLCTL